MDAKVEGQLYRRLISKVVEALTDGGCMIVMIIMVASLRDGRVVSFLFPDARLSRNA